MKKNKTLFQQLHEANEKIKELNNANEVNLIEACKYGYNYHKITSFPELNFEDACRQNFLQILENKKYEKI